MSPPVAPARPAPLRICLLTGGGYPYRRDALGGWCRTLVEGLDHVTFDLLTVVDREPPTAPAYPLPGHVTSARAVLVAPEPKRKGGAEDDQTVAAAVRLCRGLLGEPKQADQMFATGLRMLAQQSDPPAGAALGDGALGHGALGDGALGDVLLGDVLLDAWRAGRAFEADQRLPLPRLSLRDARAASTLLRHAIRVLSVPVGPADLLHCVGGSTPLLAALGAHWRTGTPLLLTEACAPADGRSRPAEDRLSPAVRTVLRRFRRSVARTGYAEAGLIAPLSAYHYGWALRHGARPARVVPVPAGVDPAEHPSVPETGVPETGRPAVLWAGSGGPDSALAPVLAAHGSVVAAVPEAVLHLVGVTPAHEDHCARQVKRAGLSQAVRMHPQPARPGHRYPGHIVVHVPGAADPPYRLIEFMMAGRAIVAVDIGPAAETLGDAGVLVPPDDPAALAEACIALLGSPERRKALGEAARRRALLHYTTDRVVRAYAALYTDLAGPPPAPVVELTLAVPAPRTEIPATVRWLTREDR